MESHVLQGLSEWIGLPSGLQSTLAVALEENWNLGIFKDLLQENPNGTPRDGGYGGCNNDAFSVFGFLAFLLAAANLFMMMARKKRDLVNQEFGETCYIEKDLKKEAVQASYSLLRGFLNALDAYDNECSNFVMCQAAQEAAKLGQVGQIMAKIGSANAESWLVNMNSTLHNGTEYAGVYGSSLEDCRIHFPCRKLHKTYKKPNLIP